ncbi:MAG: hypothetical protein ACOYT4_05095 [Nanoarchaeota archaeon]
MNPKKLIFFIILFLVFILAYFFFIGTTPEEPSCIDLNYVIKLDYDACYFNDSIILSIKRYSDNYPINQIEAYVKEGSSINEFVFNTIPGPNKTEYYKIPAQKNPHEFNVKLGLGPVELKEICREVNLKTILVNECNNTLIRPILNLSNNHVQTNQGRINPTTEDSFEFNISTNLETNCSSDWNCSDWDECIDSVQRRKCVDNKNCFLVANVPDTVRSCIKEEQCNENWECKWSACINGYSIPKCVDKNNCKTEFRKPTKLRCVEISECAPDMECSEWGNCNVDYNFENLVFGIEKTMGLRSRICKDKNKCIADVYESQDCFVSLDIYTKVLSVNGKNYLEVYNKLDNKLIARIALPEEGEYSFDINLF